MPPKKTTKKTVKKQTPKISKEEEHGLFLWMLQQKLDYMSGKLKPYQKESLEELVQKCKHAGMTIELSKEEHDFLRNVLNSGIEETLKQMPKTKKEKSMDEGFSFMLYLIQRKLDNMAGVLEDEEKERLEKGLEQAEMPLELTKDEHKLLHDILEKLVEDNDT